MRRCFLILYMNVKLSPKVQQRLKRLYKTDKKLVSRIEKQLKLFEANPKHLSLRTHKLTGNLTNLWSISINRDIRMVYILMDNNVAYFVDLGTHDEVYKT